MRPAGQWMRKNPGDTLGALGVAGGLGYAMFSSQQPKYPNTPMQQPNWQNGNPAPKLSAGNLNSVYDGPAMARIPALQNPHRSAEYGRVLSQLTTPMKMATFSRRLEKEAAMRDWHQLHNIFTSPPSVEDAQNVANNAIQRQTSRIPAIALAGGAGMIGAGALAMLSRKFNLAKIPSQLASIARFKAAAYKYKKAPVQYNGDVDLSDLARTKKVDTKLPPASTCEHLYKAGNNPDLLTAYVDTLYPQASIPSQSEHALSLPKTSAFLGVPLGPSQVPVPREPHPDIIASRTLAKAGHALKQANPLSRRAFLGTMGRGVANTALRPVDRAVRLGTTMAGAAQAAPKLMQPANMGNMLNTGAATLDAAGKAMQGGPFLGAVGSLWKGMRRYALPTAIGTGAVAAAPHILELLSKLGEEKQAVGLYSTFFGPTEADKAKQRLEEEAAAQQAASDDIARIQSEPEVNPDVGMAEPTPAPPPEPEPVPAPQSPVMAPKPNPGVLRPPMPAKPPTALPTSVQGLLQPPPKPAATPGAAVQAPQPAPQPTPAPKPAPPPPGAAGAAMRSALAGGASPAQAKATVQNEDEPFKLPPNLANIAAQSKEETAKGQQAVQSLPQQQTQPGSGGASTPPEEARPGDPAYSGGGTPKPEQPAVGRFYGAIQRAQALNANRKAMLQRMSTSRTMSASQRANAQAELDRINSGMDNNIVAGLKKDQMQGAEDYLQQGFSPSTVAGWQGNNTMQNGKAVSTRGYWEQDAANQYNQERGMKPMQNPYAVYNPKAKGLEGEATSEPVMGQGAGGVSLAQGHATPMSPVRNMNAATKPLPNMTAGMFHPSLKPGGGGAGGAPSLGGAASLSGAAGFTPPKAPKAGLGSPLGVPGQKAAMYRGLEKVGVGAQMAASAAQFGRAAKPWYSRAASAVGNFIGGSRNVAPAQRWYNNKWVQPVWGAATGAAQGAAVDSLAGLAGYDTGGAGMYSGAGMGAFARAPGVRGFINRQGANMGMSRHLGNIVHDQFKMTGHRNPILSTIGLPGKSLQSKIQAGLLFAGTGAETVRNMAVNRGREAAMDTANQLASRFGFQNIDHMLSSPTGQFMAGYNRNGLMGGLQQGWGALTPEQKYSVGAGLMGMGAGAGTMAFTDHTGAGLGMMGLGALGVGHGLGAFDGMGQQMGAMMRSRDDMSRNEMQNAAG